MPFGADAIILVNLYIDILAIAPVASAVNGNDSLPHAVNPASSAGKSHKIDVAKAGAVIIISN